MTVSYTPATISIHALLAESDGDPIPALPHGIQFLSTLSLRRATPCTDLPGPWTRISIHALLAESDRSGGPWQGECKISIHALLAESDSLRSCMPTAPRYFYPRSPCGERPPWRCPALRPWDFYPRSPCGERQMVHEVLDDKQIFLSTLSLRRATHLIYFGFYAI